MSATAIERTADAAASAAQPLTMAGALNAALRDAMEADDRVVVYGEDVGPLGGVFRVTDGLQARFGDERVWDSQRRVTAGRTCGRPWSGSGRT